MQNYIFATILLLAILQGSVHRRVRCSG